MNYRVIYLNRARREWLPGNFTLAAAEKIRRSLSNRGLTAWVVDSDGRFVPVKGAKREPGWLP